MTALYIIAAIVVIVIALLMLRLSVTVDYSKSGFMMIAAAGPVKITIPGKKKKEKKQKPKEKKQKRKLPPIKDLIRDLLKALGSFRKKLLVNELRINYVAGAEDAAQAAIRYGMANAAFGAFVPLLDNALNIKKRKFDISVSFEEQKSSVAVYFKLSIAVYQILAIAWMMLWSTSGRRIIFTRKERRNDNG